MKKMAVILLTVSMVISLAACGGGRKSAEEKTSDTGSTTEAVSAENNSAENNLPEAAPEPGSEEDTLVAEPESNGNTSETVTENRQAEDEAESEPVEEAEGMKILVAYFSATNTTKGVAENLAEGIGADIYEIVPENPYTDADLDYHDDNSRTTIEMNDPDARPSISGSVESMDQYDVIFLGYPIWWGEAPRIINTFVEMYDFNGKTVIPFCTSGGSGMGSSAANLHDATSGATWLEGKRFSGDASVSELVEWADGLGIALQ